MKEVQLEEPLSLGSTDNSKLVRMFAELLSDPEFTFASFTRVADWRGLKRAIETSGLRLVLSGGETFVPIKIAYSPSVDGVERFASKGGALGWHNDGLSGDAVPRGLLLYCEHPGALGSPTLLADSRDVVAKLSKETERKLLEFECVYYTSRGHEVSHPVLSLDESGHPLIRLGQRACVRARSARCWDLRETHSLMSELYWAIDSSISSRQTWQEGKLLLFNNQRFLHARDAPGADPRRHLVRAWLNPAWLGV